MAVPICPCGSAFSESDRMGTVSFVCRKCGSVVREDGAAASGEPVVDHLNAEIHRNRWRAVLGLAAKARETPEVAESHPRFLRSTFVALAAGPVLSGVAFVSSQVDGMEMVAAVLGVVAVVGILATLAGLVKFIGESTAPSLAGRTDPRRAIEIYQLALLNERWKVAHACLSRVAKRATGTPSIPSLGMERKLFSAETPAELSALWKYLMFRGRETKYARTGACSVLKIREVESGIAVASMEMKLQIPKYSLPMSEGPSKFGVVKADFHFDLPVYECERLWYLLEAGVGE